MKIRAVIFPAPGQVALVERDLEAPAPGQLLVRTVCTLISPGTESTVLHQRWAPDTHWARWGRFPFSPGYSLVGVVEAVGDGVTGWKPGDRVAARAPHASHVLVPVAQAVPIPPEVTDTQAAWMALGKIVQVGVRAAQHCLGDAVAVVGCGPLGQLAVQYARLSGARAVVAIDTIPARLELARRLGATATSLGTAQQAADDVRAAAAPAGGADVVYDATGHPAAFAQCLSLPRRFGTVVLLGDAGDPRQQTLTPDVITRGLRIVGAHDGHPPQELPPGQPGWTGPAMMALVLRYLADGRLQVDPLISHRFAPEQAAEAYRILNEQRDRTMGVLFTWA